MALAASKTGKTLRRAMPAKKPVPTDSYSRRIAARMRELREARGWTVADLAERVNRALPNSMKLANGTLHNWDNATRKIDPDYYPVIAAAFGLSTRGFLPAE